MQTEIEQEVGYLDIKAASRYLSLPVNTIRMYIKQRRIPFIKLPGGSKSPIRFRKADLDAWMRQGLQQPAPQVNENKEEY